MALKTLIEAAMMLGLRVETIEYFAERCPKPGQDRKLKAVNTDLGPMFDESELLAYANYLREPWPKPKGGGRPTIPKAIADDVKDESHHGCAICGLMDNGEVAHIDAVADTLNNSPANLIFLCPNHHTKYDLGVRPSSNITLDVVRSAKLLKRTSRVRVLKYEANATKSLQALIRFLKDAEEKMAVAPDQDHRSIYLTEVKGLLATIPELTKNSQQEAGKDKLVTEPERELAKAAPRLAALAAAVTSSSTESDIRSRARSVVAEVDTILIDIDEVDCPHCGGRGQTGLVGDFCSYCKGSCVVTEAKHDAYDPSLVDEIDCPHCGGRGTTGLVSDICAFCKGSCVVSHERYDEYDRSEIDEVGCPHCNGRGQTGLAGDICAYCNGSCIVSQSKYDSYDPKTIDEVECPHCHGRGQTGLVGDICSYCGGSCVVNQAKHEEYNPSKIDEVECPHCRGRGTTGFAGDVCALCKGSCVVGRVKAHAYANSRHSRDR